MRTKYLVLVMLMTLAAHQSCSQNTKMETDNSNTYRILTPEETRVIVNRGTEMPFSREKTKVLPM